MLVEPVGFVKELRHLLYLIDDNLANRLTRGELAAKQLGIVEVAAELFRFKKIDPQRMRVGRPQESSLARLPRPPKKESLGPWRWEL